MKKVILFYFLLTLFFFSRSIFGNVVKGVPHEKFEEILSGKKMEKGVKLDTELDENDLEDIIKKYKEVYKEYTKEDFPKSPWDQLLCAIKAVFESWNNKRAIEYRRIHNIPDTWGTACNVQTMVFGNMGYDSATGVAFSRNPSTGEKEIFGEYLPNAQGEDVVAGIRTPKPIAELKNEMPKAYKELVSIFKKLEKHYRDMQDMEFTIEKGKVYMLQTRTGKRTPRAKVKKRYHDHVPTRHTYSLSV
jgi:pyruvate,orthophosphate dikinase